MSKIEELEKRVAALEAEVAKLRIAPQHFHYHYIPPAPIYAPMPAYPQGPIWTVPNTNPQHWPTVICGPSGLQGQA